VATVQAAYAWLMSFGCLGIFRRFLSRPSPAIRWLSDASYWLYLTHLPLLFVLQAPMRPLEFSAWLKFALATVTCTGLLLVAYQFGVRYTWLGTLLNGPRRKAGAPRA
jgi:peptidoglycan/LPS O-acetylase OafA/YrhL